VTAFAAAFVFRLPFMNAGLFHHDEVLLARAVEGCFDQHRLLPSFNGRYGAVLINLVLYTPYRLLTGERAERVIPFTGILTGALLVAGILLLARELTRDGVAGGLAAAFGGCSTLFLTSSSTGKENTPQLALVVLAAWLVARGAARRSFAPRLGGIVLFALGLTMHEAGVALVPAFAFLIVACALHNKLGWRAIAIDLGALAVALVLPIRISIWDDFKRTLVVRTDTPTFLGFSSPRFPMALHDLLPAFGAATLVLGVIGLIVAVWRRQAVLALAAWPLVFFFFAGVNSYSARYLLYVLPPVAIFAAAGAAHFIRRWLSDRGGLAIAVASAVAVLCCAGGVAKAYPLLAARARSSGPKAMALVVKEQTEPDAIFVGVDDLIFVEYYAGRRTLMIPVNNPAAIVKFVYDLKERARTGAHLYAGGYYSISYDRGLFRDLMQRAFRFVPVAPVVNEWYYGPELADVRFDDALCRLEPL
jgi:hypothetical protein